MNAVTAAIKSAFDGVAIGQFVNWLNTIVDRRGIADYHRKREGEPAVTAARGARRRGGDLGLGRSGRRKRRRRRTGADRRVPRQLVRTRTAT